MPLFGVALLYKVLDYVLGRAMGYGLKALAL